MQKICWLAGSVLQKKNLFPFSKLSQQLENSFKSTVKMSTAATQINKYGDFLKFMELVGSLKVSLNFIYLLLNHECINFQIF